MEDITVIQNLICPTSKIKKGQIVHPQFWDESLDYKNKKIAVIGSGATAITIVPAIAEQGRTRCNDSKVPNICCLWT